MKSRLGVLIIALSLATLAACSSVPISSEIPASIANASTPADHQKIADYFAQKAASYESEAAQHEKMAASYAGRPKFDLPAMAAHCRSLHDQFVNAAKEARQLAEAHRQLATTPVK